MRTSNNIDGIELYLNKSEKKFPLIITFGGHKALGPAGPSVTPFEFKKSLVSIYGTEINYIFIRDIEKSWYFQGISGLSKNLEENIKGLKGIIDDLKISKSIVMGSSSGGFASILYGALLNLDKVIAFGPQTFISNKKLEKYNEARWRCETCFLDSKEYKSIDHKYYDLSELKHVKYKTEIEIVVDNNYPPDLNHIDNVRDLNNLSVHYINGPSTHSIAGYLKTKNKLNDYLKI